MKKGRTTDNISQDGAVFRLPDRVFRAQTDEGELNRLISDYTPFLRSLVHKSIIAGRFGPDDLFSVSMEAFWEAVKAFSAERGAFIPFCTVIVKRALFAFAKRESARRGRETPFSAMAAKDADGNEKEYDPADERDFTNPVKYEIDAIKDEAAAYGINFLKLAQHSPKAGKTQAVCFEAVRILMRDAGLSAQMRRGGYLPVKELAEKLKVQRKVIERHRQYIVVVALIASDDYPHLQERIGIKRYGI